MTILNIKLTEKVSGRKLTLGHATVRKGFQVLLVIVLYVRDSSGFSRDTRTPYLLCRKISLQSVGPQKASKLKVE